MAGYIGSKAVSVNTTSATITGDASIGGDLSLGDSDKIILGAGSDLQIYHDGSNSYVADTGTGRLRLRGNDRVDIYGGDGTKQMAKFLDGAEVGLYHNNALKLATKATGVTVTGEMAATTMDLSSNAVIDGTALVTGVLTTTAQTVFNGGFAAGGVSTFADGSAGAPSITNTGDVDTGIYFPSANEIAFTEGGVERVRLKNGGDFLVGKNTQNSTTKGCQINETGIVLATVDGEICFQANRLTDDGVLFTFQQASATIGTISSSGATVSYNAFSGSHWSRLADNSQPTILKGTLIETIDEMCDWYQVVFTVPATTKVNEEGETVEDIAAQSMQESISLPDGASVGNTISHTYNGVTYSATIVKEDDNKHPKCKISDTADSTRIYGVFSAWDNDDDNVNDMYVTAVGTHVVRVHGGQTVSAGDLLVSNGDGTTKVQDDDIIRSKTLGKVLTNIKQETYADDSYTVPCALYCG